MRRRHRSIEKRRKGRTTERVWTNFDPCSLYTSDSHFKQSLVPYFLPVKVRINTALALHCITTNHISTDSQTEKRSLEQKYAQSQSLVDRISAM